MSYLDALKAQLPIDEGVKDHAYQDSKGYWTIGVGHLIDKRLNGHVSGAVIALMLEEDIALADRAARVLVPPFDALSEARKEVICNMAFNLGQQRLSGFVNTLRAINEGRYDAAADGMSSSLWATQVGERATRLVKQMREG